MYFTVRSAFSNYFKYDNKYDNYYKVSLGKMSVYERILKRAENEAQATVDSEKADA